MKSKQTLKKLYYDLFSTNFLINYGYFDITPKNNQDLTDLNNYGKADAFYLKIFNMSKLAEYISSNPFYNKKFLENEKVYSTEPLTFTIPIYLKMSNRSRKTYNKALTKLKLHGIQRNKHLIFLQAKIWNGLKSVSRKH